MKKIQLKKAPRFKTSEQEAEFWEKHSTADFDLLAVDPEEVMTELKAHHQAKQNVTLRLESELMRRLKKKAHRAGIKYQTFVREWLWRAVA